MRKVAIVGSAPGSEMLAPFEDLTWEIWALVQHVHKYPRFSRVFEIHDNLSDEYQKDLVSKYPNLVVGSGFQYETGNVTKFPFDEAEKLFGSLYLTSTIAYMVALAIIEGVTHISIYGVDMAVDDNEYFHQQACVAAWIGFAKGKGIEVSLPKNAALLKSSYLYGRTYKEDCGTPPFTYQGFLGLAKQHGERMQALQDQIDKLQSQIHTHHGSKQSYERMAKVARAIEAGQVIESLSQTAIIR